MHYTISLPGLSVSDQQYVLQLGASDGVQEWVASYLVYKMLSSRKGRNCVNIIIIIIGLTSYLLFPYAGPLHIPISVVYRSYAIHIVVGTTNGIYVRILCVIDRHTFQYVLLNWWDCIFVSCSGALGRQGMASVSQSVSQIKAFPSITSSFMVA